jgi:hypothetical protein
MKFFRVFFAFSIAAILAGCATNSDRINERLAGIPESGRAYLTGTFAVECSPQKENCYHMFNSLTAYFKNLEDTDVGNNLNATFGGAIIKDTEYDFVNREKREKGYHFCMALPAGPYAFYTLTFTNFAGGGTGYSIKKENQFNLPFTLAKGEIINIGKVKITTESGKNIFGLGVALPGHLSISPVTDQDIKSAIQKCPESVRNKTVRNAFLKIEDAKGNSFVKAENTK